MMEDSAIVELLYNHSEEGISKLSEKYGGLLGSVASNVLRNDDDATECVNDVYMKVWNLIPPYRPDYLRSFVCKLARSIAIDKYRYNKREKRNGEGNVLFSELEENEIPADTSAEMPDSSVSGEINRFVAALPVRDRVLFVRRYFMAEGTADIAKRFDMSENAVSVRLFRLRDKLKKYLTERGYEI